MRRRRLRVCRRGGGGVNSTSTRSPRSTVATITPPNNGVVCRTGGGCTETGVALLVSVVLDPDGHEDRQKHRSCHGASDHSRKRERRGTTPRFIRNHRPIRSTLRNGGRGRDRGRRRGRAISAAPAGHGKGRVGDGDERSCAVQVACMYVCSQRRHEDAGETRRPPLAGEFVGTNQPYSSVDRLKQRCGHA